MTSRKDDVVLIQRSGFLRGYGFAREEGCIVVDTRAVPYERLKT